MSTSLIGYGHALIPLVYGYAPPVDSHNHFPACVVCLWIVNKSEFIGCSAVCHAFRHRVSFADRTGREISHGRERERSSQGSDPEHYEVGHDHGGQRPQRQDRASERLDCCGRPVRLADQMQ